MTLSSAIYDLSSCSISIPALGIFCLFIFSTCRACAVLISLWTNGIQHLVFIDHSYMFIGKTCFILCFLPVFCSFDTYVYVYYPYRVSFHIVWGKIWGSLFFTYGYRFCSSTILWKDSSLLYWITLLIEHVCVGLSLDSLFYSINLHINHYTVFLNIHSNSWNQIVQDLQVFPFFPPFWLSYCLRICM